MTFIHHQDMERLKALRLRGPIMKIWNKDSQGEADMPKSLQDYSVNSDGLNNMKKNCTFVSVHELTMRYLRAFPGTRISIMINSKTCVGADYTVGHVTVLHTEAVLVG